MTQPIEDEDDWWDEEDELDEEWCFDCLSYYCECYLDYLDAE